MRGAEEQALQVPRVSKFRSITGKGVLGRVEGREIAIGNRALLDQISVQHGHWSMRADALRREGAVDRAAQRRLTAGRRPDGGLGEGRRSQQAGAQQGGEEGTDHGRELRSAKGAHDPAFGAAVQPGPVPRNRPIAGQKLTSPGCFYHHTGRMAPMERSE